MSKVTIEEWIDALRSGEYKQAKKTLRNSNTGGFCCLGVLCDLVNPEAWSGEIWRADGRGVGGWDVPLGAMLEDVPAGLSTRELVDLNDLQKYTFDEIADYIEQEYT